MLNDLLTLFLYDFLHEFILFYFQFQKWCFDEFPIKLTLKLHLVIGSLIVRNLRNGIIIVEIYQNTIPQF